MPVSKSNAKSLAVDYANWTRCDLENDPENEVAMHANALYRSQKRTGIVMMDYDLLQYFMNKCPLWSVCYVA